MIRRDKYVISTCCQKKFKLHFKLKWRWREFSQLWKVCKFCSVVKKKIGSKNTKTKKQMKLFYWTKTRTKSFASLVSSQFHFRKTTQKCFVFFSLQKSATWKFPSLKISKLNARRFLKLIRMLRNDLVSVKINLHSWRNWNSSAHRKVRNSKGIFGYQVKLLYSNIGLENRVSTFSHPLPPEYSLFCMWSWHQMPLLRISSSFSFDLDFCAKNGLFVGQFEKLTFLEA